jgi:hypothetical protein
MRMSNTQQGMKNSEVLKEKYLIYNAHYSIFKSDNLSSLLTGMGGALSDLRATSVCSVFLETLNLNDSSKL